MAGRGELPCVRQAARREYLGDCAMSDKLAEPLALRPRDAARVLGISTRTLWAMTAPRGPIPCVRVGHGTRQLVLYPLDGLRAWLANRAA
jgi:hypothetical protein